MAVLALIGVFVGMVGVRTNIIGSNESRELRRFQAFVRTHHARALYDGVIRKLIVNESSNVIRVQRNGETREQFQFEEWSLRGDRIREYRFTPRGVLGEQSLTLEYGDQEHTLHVNRLTGLVGSKDRSS